VVDLTARYITLLAERTAYNAYSNHNDSTPNITDARMAMQDCGLLVPTMTAGEEEWKQILRKPLDFYNEETGAREMEQQRRDAEDTADVKEFIDWVQGDQNKEIRRIAGTLKDIATNPTEQLDQLEMEDYLNSMFLRSRGSIDANVLSSTHEEAQQNRSRVTIPRDRSRGPLRAKDGQNRRRRRRVDRGMVSEDSGTGCQRRRVKTW
jgi:hypothetical protein